MRFFLMLGSLLLAAPAVADPYQQLGACDSAGAPALHRIEVTSGSADTTVYADDENYALGNGVWMYPESNGIWIDKLPGVYLEGLSNANLQRGGGNVLMPDDADICLDGGGLIVPDGFLL